MLKPKPRPGSLPRLKADASVDQPTRKFDATFPPFFTEADIKRAQRQEAERDLTFSALSRARTKAEELAGAMRTDAFDDWLRRCVVSAQLPSEWTQARVLYESYIDHAKTFGRNRSQKALSVQELATETQWGRMMATVFPNKKRRTAGWYYPIRCKR